MIEVGKLKPYCQVGIWLVVFASCIEFTLQALDETPALAWVPRAVTGTGYLEDCRLRVAQALKEYREKRTGQQKHLAVVIGISEVRQGVQLSAVAQGIGPQWKILGLGGAGLGVGSIQSYANLVLASELQPDVVIVGLGVHQLVNHRSRPQGVADPNLMGELQAGNFRSTVVALRNSLWTYSRREDINVSVESAVLDLRARMLAAFGVPLPETDAHRRSPWREMIKSDWPEHFSAATLKAQEHWYESLGVFDLAAYEDPPVAMATLMGIIEQFRLRGTKVVLVIMPQHSTLNQRIPPKAFEVLKQNLRSRFPGNEPPLLDFRTTVGDSGFVDLPHLNQTGSWELSQRLGSSVRSLLPDGTPLMALH